MHGIWLFSLFHCHKSIVCFVFSPAEIYFAKTYNGKKLIGGTYMKTRFNAYTDNTFNRRDWRFGQERHLGILGPVIRAEVGDIIRITLYNKSPQPVSIFLQGVSLTAKQNGMWLKDPCKFAAALS